MNNEYHLIIAGGETSTASFGPVDNEDAIFDLIAKNFNRCTDADWCIVVKIVTGQPLEIYTINPYDCQPEHDPDNDRWGRYDEEDSFNREAYG